MNHQSSQPIRVLHVIGTMNLGGAESRIMELYRCIDRSQVQFDFLVHTKDDGQYGEEIKRLGGHIYKLPQFKVMNYFAYRKAIEDFFREHKEHKVIQGHMTSTAAIYLPIAKKANPEVLTIAHSRNSGVAKGPKGIATKFIRRNLKYKADYCFTCSKEAGIDVFGEDWVRKGKVWTVPNGINVNRFRYNETVRREVREELGITDKFVIGHIGRFQFMKNHTYLVDVFAKLCERRDDMMLVLLGKGVDEEQIKNKVKALGLENKVMFLGHHMDVERYYQAFDYFVFPSLFEGLPGCVTEAQAAGLHCLISDKITSEVGMTSLVSYRSIEEAPELWAKEILDNADAALVREDVCEQIAAKGFDVNAQAKDMAEFYRTGVNPPGSMTVM